MKSLVVFLVVSMYCLVAQAEVCIDLERVKMIESSGNPRAHNTYSHARGLYQVTPICLRDWNNYHPNDIHTEKELFNSVVNTKIADWYINTRIPQMLQHYGIEDTVNNRLIAYNAGVGCLIGGRSLPSETVEYIRKYHEGGSDGRLQ